MRLSPATTQTPFQAARPESPGYPSGNQQRGECHACDNPGVVQPGRPDSHVRYAWRFQSHDRCCALISLNLARARSNLSLKSHIASRISRKVADVLALSAFPKVKILLLRKYPMIVGSEILWPVKLPELRAALVGLGMIWMSS